MTLLPTTLKEDEGVKSRAFLPSFTSLFELEFRAFPLLRLSNVAKINAQTMYHYNNKIMNATQANYTANNYNEKNNSAEFVGILERIKTNAHKGVFSVEVKSLSSATKKALQKDGYKIVDCSDPRDGYTEYSIRWD